MAIATDKHSTTPPPAEEHEMHTRGHGEHTDPDHDIDTKRTVIVLLAASAAVFGSVWVLYIVYSMLIHDYKVRKVEQAPTEQVDQLREYEARMLDAGEEPKRKSIEDSIRELTTR